MNKIKCKWFAATCGILGVAGCVFYLGFVWAIAWQNSNAIRDSAINREIRKVSSNYNVYTNLWCKLVREHGTEEAALAHLRAWAKARVDYDAVVKDWQDGLRTCPESPAPLTHYTTREAQDLNTLGYDVPYGCSTTFVGVTKEWDKADTDHEGRIIMGGYVDDFGL